MTEFIKLDHRKSILHCVNCGGCQELALRYCNCHFECIFCFAINYAWPSRWENARPIKECSSKQIVESISREISCRRYDWIRISGGEPLLNKKRTREMVEMLLLLDKTIGHSQRIVVQTNGVALPNKEVQIELTKLFTAKNLKVLIELSFKGTNIHEFSLLTQRKPKVYFRQIDGYYVLHELMSRNNISVRARIGIGPHPKSVIFVYPDTFPTAVNAEKPIEAMFHPSKWCEDFRKIHQNELQLHGYMAIEDINVTEGGINARTQLNMPAIARLLERNLILDRINVVNEYRDFCRISKERFPYLNQTQREELERQYCQIRSEFNIVPAQAYLRKGEFPN